MGSGQKTGDAQNGKSGAWQIERERSPRKSKRSQRQGKEMLRDAFRNAKRRIASRRATVAGARTRCKRAARRMHALAASAQGGRCAYPIIKPEDCAFLTGVCLLLLLYRLALPAVLEQTADRHATPGASRARGMQTSAKFVQKSAELHEFEIPALSHLPTIRPGARHQER